MNSLFTTGGVLTSEMQQAEIALRDNTRASIVFVVVDDPYATPDTACLLRDEVMWELASRLQGRYMLYEFDCLTAEQTSIPRHCRQLTDRPACLFAYNLDAVAALDADRYGALIDGLNRHREDIRATCTALVLWLTSDTLRDVQNRAPDFADWRTACIAFTVKQGMNVGRTAPGGVSIRQADEMHRQIARYEEMLARPNLEPAMAAEFQRQRALLYGQLGQREQSEAASVAEISLLSDLSTQQRAERIYLDYLIERHGSIDPRGVAQTVRSLTLPLDEVYVSLTVERESRQDYLSPEQVDEATRSSLDLIALNRLDPAQYPPADLRRDRVRLRSEEYTETVDLPRAVRENSRAVILGDPGAGKTTLTRFLAVRFARACRDDMPVVVDREDNDYGKTRLPIPLRVAGYVDALRHNRNLSLRAYLPQAFGEVALAPEELRTLFDQALGNGAAFVILDGLDEVADARDRVEIARAIDSFAAGIGGLPNRIVATSRIAGYREAQLGAMFQQFTLRDMAPDQIARFLERWCAACERFHTPQGSGDAIRQRAEADRSTLLAAVEHSPGVRRLAGNPLLLTILALIHRNSARLPERRIELYQLAANTLLRDWRLAQAGSEAQVVEEYEALELLGPLAYWMHRNEPTGLIDADEARRLLCEFYGEARGLGPNHPNVRAAIDDFLRRVREQTGLFVERAPGKYGFMHLTFEEYFAARELVSDFVSAADRIREHRHDPRWEEPIRLAIAYERPKNAARLVRAALWNADSAANTGYMPSPYEEILRRDLLLAARCLGDCAAIEPMLAQEVTAELVAICLNREGKGRYRPLVTRALDTLEEVRTSELGQEALRLFLATLTGENRSEYPAAVEALGRVGQGSDQVQQALLQSLKDKESDVRSKAAEALGRIGKCSPEVLQALMDAFKDAEFEVRVAAAAALGKLAQGSPEVLQALLCALKMNNHNIRYWAAEALGMIGQGSSEVLQALLLALKDEDFLVPIGAALALGRVGQGSSEVLQALLFALESKRTKLGFGRFAVMEALGMLGQGSSEVIQTLLVALKDDIDMVRSSAAAALGEVGQGSPEVLQALLLALKDEFFLVRSEAAKALGKVGQGSPESLQALHQALKDEDNRVCTAAAEALGGEKQGLCEILQALLHCLKYKERRARAVVASGLGKLGRGSAEALDAVLQIIRDGDDDAEDGAWESLWELTAPKGDQ